MSDERAELLARGPKGDQGEQGGQGEQGEQGKRGESLNRATRRAIVFLVALSLLFGVGNLFYTSYVVRGNTQQRCASLRGLATIPIPQPVAGHESRQFAEALENAYRKRAAELGCTPGKP